MQNFLGADYAIRMGYYVLNYAYYATFSSAILKCRYYDKNHIFPIEAILEHKQVPCMRSKILFTIFKYLFSFQSYSSFLKYAN